MIVPDPQHPSATAAAPTLSVPAEPDSADREIILARLVEFETAAAGAPNIKPVAILIRDAEGATIGGLWGNTVFRWLVIELFFVPQQLRGGGLGTTIMAHAEAIARERGCIGIWLDTYDFQAPGFYEKLGFHPFGTLQGQPPGGSRIFMRKNLVG